MADAPRPFDRATLPGRGPGRPSSGTTRFAGDALDPSARRLVAATRWQQKQSQTPGERDPQSRSIQTGGSISAARAEHRAERRFDGEGKTFSPDAKINGGPGVSAKNPWN
jgi:hypothetical protein